jgi:hypothetical protein
MTRNTTSKIEPGAVAIPRDRDAAVLRLGEREVAVTNLR